MNVSALKSSFEKRFYNNKHLILTADAPACIVLFADAAEDIRLTLPLPVKLSAAGAAYPQGRVSICDDSDDSVFTLIPSAPEKNAAFEPVIRVVTEFYRKHPDMSGADILFSCPAPELLAGKAEYAVAAQKLICALNGKDFDTDELIQLFGEIPAYIIAEIANAREGFASLTAVRSLRQEFFPFPLKGIRLLIFKTDTDRAGCAPQLNRDPKVTDGLCAALRAGDIERFAYVLTQSCYSHQSPPYDKKLSFAVRCALEQKYTLGAAVCGRYALCIVKEEYAELTAREIMRSYEEQTSKRAQLFICG